MDATLKYYGGWDLDPDTGEDEDGPHMLGNGKDAPDGQKKILFVTGDVDPWTVLAVTEDKGNKDHPSVSVHGASHHFWTHQIKESDTEQVREARDKIYETVYGWLGLSRAPKEEYSVQSVAVETH